jgi:hypothetical protein
MYFQASVLLPNLEGVAVLHATDIKYGAKAENVTNNNVFCTSVDTDLQRSYTTTFAQTANLTTFMQKDTITVDLGYVVNGAFSYKMKNYSADDDTFVMKVQVQLSDVKSTGNGTEHDIYLSVKFGNVFVVGT